jgi:hypothetical protein
MFEVEMKKMPKILEKAFNKVFVSGILDEKEMKAMVKFVAPQKKIETNQEDYKLAVYFKAMVEKYNKAVVVNLPKQLNSFHRLREKHSDKLIKSVILRTLSDSFWVNVVIDANTLERKFDQLCGKFNIKDVNIEVDETLEIDFDEQDWSY